MESLLIVRRFRERKPGQGSMTQRIENVDPPFDRRPVQVTLAVIASVAFVWMWATSWNAAAPRQHTPSMVLGGTVLIQIDLNRAEARELAVLPGVGPVLANRIVANRDRLGRFESVDDLGRVHGIGPKTLGQIRQICFVDAASPELQSGRQVASTAAVDPPTHQGSFDPTGR